MKYVKIYWSDVDNFLQTGVILLYMTSILELSDDEVDNLFIGVSLL